jgi:hypothetical protein
MPIITIDSKEYDTESLSERSDSTVNQPSIR